MSRRLLVTMTETIHVQRTPEVVFDYTQDSAHRSGWDRGVIGAELLTREPRRMRLHVKGIGRFTVEYQLFRRPVRTHERGVRRCLLVVDEWRRGLLGLRAHSHRYAMEPDEHARMQAHTGARALDVTDSTLIEAVDAAFHGIRQGHPGGRDGHFIGASPCGQAQRWQ